QLLFNGRVDEPQKSLELPAAGAWHWRMASIAADGALGPYGDAQILDVTGWLGGYNFQWAWSSGFVAGMNC
ncbi:aminoacetone oxidase family FAD-binding enzyme, partial [Pseudomonas sp. MWU12-2534b]